MESYKNSTVYLNKILPKNNIDSSESTARSFIEAIDQSRKKFPKAIPVLASAYQVVSSNLNRLGYKTINCNLGLDPEENKYPRIQTKTGHKTVFYLSESHKHLAQLAGMVWGADSINTYQDPCNTKYAVVLFPVGKTTKQLFTLLGRLHDKNISVGIIPIENSITDWSTIVCYLIKDEFDYTPHTALYISDLWKKEEHSVLNKELSRTPDIALFSGHGNPADMRISEDLVLCGRATASNTNLQSLPCWNSQECGKQHVFNRSADSKVGLSSISPLSGHVNILSGCNMAPLGSSWLSTGHSLVDQLLGDGLQAIVSTTLLTKDIQLDLLFIALIYEGYSLGEVIKKSNLTREIAHKEVAPTHEHPGTFMLLGNPALKFEKTIGSVTECKINYGILAQDRVQIKYIATDHIYGLPKDILNCSFNEKNIRKLYLFGIKESSDHKILIQQKFNDLANTVCPLLKDYLKNSKFWQAWATYFKGLPDQNNEDLEPHKLLLDYILDFQRDCTLLVDAFKRQQHYLDYEVESLIDIAIEKIRSMSELAMNSVYAVTTTHGSMLFKGWQHLYLREKVFQMEKYCHCGQFPVTSYEFNSLVQADIVRYVYECLGCGVIGEDAGSDILIVNNIPKKIGRNKVLSANFHVNIKNIATVFSALLTIEPWGKSEQIKGNIVTELIFTNSKFDLQLAIPNDIVKGKYLLNVIFIINGALIHKRRILQIE